MFESCNSVHRLKSLDTLKYALIIASHVIHFVCRATVQVVRSWSYDLPAPSMPEQYQDAHQPSMHASGFDGREGVYMPDMH